MQMKKRGFIHLVTILVIGFLLISFGVLYRAIEKNLIIAQAYAEESDVDIEKGYNERLYIYAENTEEDQMDEQIQVPEEGEYIKVPAFEYDFESDSTYDLNVDVNAVERFIKELEEELNEKEPEDIDFK